MAPKSPPQREQQQQQQQQQQQRRSSTMTAASATIPAVETFEIPASIFQISACQDGGTSNGNMTGGLCTAAFLKAMQKATTIPKQVHNKDDDDDDDDGSSISDIDDDDNVPPNPSSSSSSKVTMSWIDLLTTMRTDMDQTLQQTFGDDAILQIPELMSSRPISTTDACTIVPSLQSLGTRRALLIGINYTNHTTTTTNTTPKTTITAMPELLSSHADVVKMSTFLETNHEFQPENTIVLMDDQEHVAPTKKNIMNAIKLLVKLTKSGDNVFVHYSGT